jgi:glucarate dehydratase
MELALWDLVGRLRELSFASLLGGAPTRPIELVCPVPAVIIEAPVARGDLADRFKEEDAVEPVVRYAVDHAHRLGFRCFKYKSAATRPAFDLAVMRGLREALPDASLRFDPNAGYPPAEAIALCRALEPLRLEFLEDPTDDQEGLARLRTEVETPVATNMAVIQVDQLAAAIRRKPVDVLLADLYMWGGPLRFRGLVHAASATGFEVAIHSLFETGIGTAANLHLAAAFGEIKRATDSGLHVLRDDVVKPGQLSLRDGAMAVPDGPGLGVELDHDRLRELTIEEHEVRP